MFGSFEFSCEQRVYKSFAATDLYTHTHTHTHTQQTLGRRVSELSHYTIILFKCSVNNNGHKAYKETENCHSFNEIINGQKLSLGKSRTDLLYKDFKPIILNMLKELKEIRKQYMNKIRL